MVGSVLVIFGCAFAHVGNPPEYRIACVIVRAYDNVFCDLEVSVYAGSAVAALRIVTVALGRWTSDYGTAEHGPTAPKTMYRALPDLSYLLKT